MDIFLNMSTLSLRGILDTSKLVGANFDDWYRNLRIVLMHEKLIDVIDKPTKEAPSLDDALAIEAYQKYLEECLTAKCIILASMGSELQRQHQDMDPPQIIEHLKKMYGGQSRTARYQLSKTLLRSILTANSQVGPRVLKMIDLIEQLQKLGCILGKELSQDLILQSLPESFSQFIVNFNMNKMSCDLHEMLNMLIDYENQITSEKKKGTAMIVGNSSKRKVKGKKKFKRKPTAPKGGVTKPKSKEGNHGEGIELDEIQEIDEPTQAQDCEIQVEQPLLDVLKLTRRLSSSVVDVQEPITITTLARANE
ncbi:hypothetical protein RJ639_041962 [Escallonia herrerae]|uniref:Gag protein n=1 Tax=Escallonia herrerae TaxID=1293975 RepID=A0AA88WQ21_9ASTE|nr:hypothetical protein RJ639_041962 [Escallonia herrerae]